MTNPNPSPDVNMSFSINEMAEMFHALHEQDRRLTEALNKGEPHPFNMINQERLTIIKSAKGKVKDLIEFYESQEDDE